MKKLTLTLLMTVFTFSLQSCRESTGEKTEKALEAIGKDIEDKTREAGEKIEEGAKKVEKEIEEEVNNTDDYDN